LRTIAAKEIKRRGISAVDAMLEEGPVYVIRNDAPAYVVLDPVLYQELQEAAHEGFVAGIQEARRELTAHKPEAVTAEQLIAELGLEA